MKPNEVEMIKPHSEQHFNNKISSYIDECEDFVLMLIFAVGPPRTPLRISKTYPMPPIAISLRATVIFYPNVKLASNSLTTQRKHRIENSTKIYLVHRTISVRI